MKYLFYPLCALFIGSNTLAFESDIGSASVTVDERVCTEPQTNTPLENAIKIGEFFLVSL